MARTTIETVHSVHHLHIPPLVGSEHPLFTQQYELGLAHSLFAEHEDNGPLHDLYLTDSFTLARHFRFFDGQHESQLYRHIGFTLGEIHGAVLGSNGSLQPNVTTLVTLHDQDTAHGYQAGRTFYFLEASRPEEWYPTDTSLIERLRELADEPERYHDSTEVIRYNIGTLLGELSGHLFPWTPEEHHTWERECIRELGMVCRIHPQCLAARQFSVSAVS